MRADCTAYPTMRTCASSSAHACDANTLNYESRSRNTAFYSSPWTMSFPLKRDDDYRMFVTRVMKAISPIELMLGGTRARTTARR